LLWFLRGDTNSKRLEEQKVNIWKLNTTKEFIGNKPLQEGDIGPMYFWQIYHFGADYICSETNYDGQGINQMEEVLMLLRTNPFSRRILMTTYNVADRHKGVLYPCHGIVIQFFCEEDAKGVRHLSLQMYQRSMDYMLGAPYNFASYSLLLYIIAAKVGMRPKRVIITAGDCHLYMSHVEQAKEQLTRDARPFPNVQLHPRVKDTPLNELTIDDFTLVAYNPHPAIKAPMSV
jgi:thymidylate synthase